MKRLLTFMTIVLLYSGAISAQPDENTLIDALLKRMEDAVLEGDATAYLANVDLSDPIFAREHTNWANDWADGDFLTDFDLDASNLQTANGYTIADLTMRWESTLEENPGMTTTFTAQFFVDTDMGIALYAGEYWEDTESEHFIILAAPGQENAADNLLPELPDIYDSVTANYGYEPNTRMQIKIYQTPQALIATTLLSLPEIAGWNEPGESLKIIDLGQQTNGIIVAHEFTHFLTFNQADDTHGNIPWWASEGIADYMAQEYISPGEQTFADPTVLTIQELAQNGDLVVWEDISVFEDTPVDLWRYVYPQGYTFMHFLTEAYGADARNAWLHNLAHDMSMDEATQDVFEVDFAELDEEFVTWLLAYDSGE